MQLENGRTMLFHLPKLPAELRVTHLNARVNEQRKKIASLQRFFVHL